MSLSIIFPVELQKCLCPLSLPFLVPVACHLALRPLSNLRNDHVAALNLGVKIHLGKCSSHMGQNHANKNSIILLALVKLLGHISIGFCFWLTMFLTSDPYNR